MSRDADAEQGRIEITAEQAVRFADTAMGRCIRVAPKPLFGAHDRVFTIGSSFSQSLRRPLAELGHAVLPAYEALDLDPRHQSAGQLRHLNFYTAATIRQEIERALSGTPGNPCFAEIAPGRWPVTGGPAGLPGGVEPWEARFQDPRRHGIVAESEAAIIDLMDKIDVLMRDGLVTAGAFVVTLAITENWFDRESGHFLWSWRAASVSPDPDRFEFRQSGYEENYDDMAWVCETIAERFPGRPIVLTVSPVIAPRTFSHDDAVVANGHGKAVLRAVASALASEFDDVTYWPSFEFSMASNDRKDDGRHMAPATVHHDVTQFIAAHRSASTDVRILTSD